MNHESELLTYLHKAIEERVTQLSEQANRRPDFIKVNKAIYDFMEAVTDENIRTALLEYEALKNEYVGLTMSYIYEAGARDSLTLYGLFLKVINSNY